MPVDFPYKAVLNVPEKDLVGIFRNIKKTFNLTYKDFTCGFYRSRSIFYFNDKKHYTMFVLHCNLSGLTVYNSGEEAEEVLGNTPRS